MAAPDVAHHGSEPRVDALQSWRSDSMCRQHPTKWWFGGHGDSSLAKAICADCAVRAPCLEFALARPDLLGIWAATTPTERTVLRRERREGVEASADGPNADAAVQAVAAEPVLIDLVAESEREAARRPDPKPSRTPRRGPRRGWRDPVPGDHAELLTPAEAARKLGVTPNTVTRWSRAGKIAAIQTMGGHRRFRRAEIERLLREANIAATHPN
jgi:excisionase family DNA binding protein